MNMLYIHVLHQRYKLLNYLLHTANLIINLQLKPAVNIDIQLPVDLLTISAKRLFLVKRHKNKNTRFSIISEFRRCGGSASLHPEMNSSPQGYAMSSSNFGICNTIQYSTLHRMRIVLICKKTTPHHQSHAL
jgi:hypothetical protein